MVGRWIPDAIADPIRIGEVTVATGDYILAGRDGIVVIPFEFAEEVTAQAEELMQTENLVRKAIKDGMDPQKAYLKYGAF